MSFFFSTFAVEYLSRRSICIDLCTASNIAKMSDEDIAIYDEIEIEDMTFDEDLQLYTYPCPCGDRFQIGLGDLQDNEDIAVCPSCSLMIRVIFDAVRLRAPLKEYGG